MKFEYATGATPLDLDEIAELIPDHITTQAELNEWEQTNILEAELWLSKFRSFGFNFSTNFHKKGFGGTGPYLSLAKILDVDFIKQLHQKMFDKTWRWAGKFRTSHKNIGIDWSHISTRVHELCDDIQYQVAHQSYSFDEIAARLHHRLIAIHPFSNGNGRHSRCLTDLFLTLQGAPKFSWGQSNLYENSVIRDQYIKALRTADRHDYRVLLEFVR